MGFKDVIAIGVLFIALGALLYLLFMQVSTESIIYQDFVANVSMNAPAQSIQFYPNMRFPDKTIKYWIEPECDDNKRQNIFKALAILSDKTILDFSRSSVRKGILFLCSEVALEPEQKTHFVAGEGGPTEILNTSLYYVIKESKVALYRPEKCVEPKVAVHEILHALGFDHNNNSESIMYPITNCNQEIDKYLIEAIDEIYKESAYPDLSIERISANETGEFLSFEIIIANNGLTDVSNVSLELYSSDKLIKEYDMAEMDMGRRKSLSVQNLRLPSGKETLKFVVKPEPPVSELSLSNNYVTITPKAS